MQEDKSLKEHIVWLQTELNLSDKELHSRGGLPGRWLIKVTSGAK